MEKKSPNAGVASVLATASMLAMEGGLGLSFRGSVEISPEDELWLNSLESPRQHIWRRRMMRGLSQSEREFVEMQKKESL